RDLLRLRDVQCRRASGVDLAEVTPAGALFTADEDCRLAVLPTLVNVRATPLFTHRVQRAPPGQRLQLLELRTRANLSPDPRGLPCDRRFGVTRLQPQHPASLWGNSHAVISCVLRDTHMAGGSGRAGQSAARSRSQPRSCG